MARNPVVDFVTFAGADNRAKMLGDTFRVIRPFFKTIHLLDTGSTDNTPDLAQEYNLNYFRQEGLNNGNWAPTIELALSQVPVGRWFVYMDSDERPSPHFLDQLFDNVRYLEKNNLGQGQVFNILHLDGKHVEFGEDVNTHVQSWENEGRIKGGRPKRNPFCKGAINRYFRNKVTTNGPHFGIDSYNRKYAWLPTYYNHYKTTNQAEISWVMCSWPFCKYHGLPKDSEEEALFQRIAVEHNIPTGQELQARARAGTLPTELLDATKQWNGSKYNLLQAYYNWANVYNFEIRNESPYCGKACCSYRDGVQY
jgi:glycosyltransferase involved in cell wall biosynthesis